MRQSGFKIRQSLLRIHRNRINADMPLRRQINPVLYPRQAMQMQLIPICVMLDAVRAAADVQICWGDINRPILENGWLAQLFDHADDRRRQLLFLEGEEIKAIGNGLRKSVPADVLRLPPCDIRPVIPQGKIQLAVYNLRADGRSLAIEGDKRLFSQGRLDCRIFGCRRIRRKSAGRGGQHGQSECGGNAELG